MKRAKCWMRWLAVYGLLAGATPVVSAAIAIVDGVPWVYSIEADEATIVQGPGSGEVTIPTAVDGYPVLGIADNAFLNCSGLTSVTIPDSIVHIGSGVFSGCSGMKNLFVPASWIGTETISRLGLPTVCSVIYGDSWTIIDGEVWSYGVTNGTAFVIAGPREGAVIIPSVLGGMPVVAIGESAFYNATELVSVTIPDSVKDIGGKAFGTCKKLASVDIGTGVQRIGTGAFSRCYRMASVSIHDLEAWCRVCFEDVNANPLSFAHHLFLDDGEMTVLTIPDTVTSIGNQTFRGCSGLVSVVIPNTVTSIGVGAFFGCSGLETISIPDSVTEIGEETFCGCSGLVSVSIGNNVTNIGDSVFYDCIGLTSVTIPESVARIGRNAFGNCYNLRQLYVHLPCILEDLGLPFDDFGRLYCEIFYGVDNVWWQYDGNDEGIMITKAYTEKNELVIPSEVNGCPVTGIGHEAFWGLSCLTSVTISDSVTDIASGAFSYCTNLTSVTIPDGVTSIGNYAFNSCSGLESVSIGKGVKAIGESAFSGCSGLKSVIIPDSVISIGNSAFEKCSGLESVSIGKCVTAIADKTFSGCSGLMSAIIGNGVTNIGYEAFSECSRLASLIIPDSVTCIGVQAFRDCSGLVIVAIGNNVTTIGYGAFIGCKELISIRIPDSVGIIGDFAFFGCTGLESLAIGDSVTIIGNSAFNGCSLASVHIPSSVSTIGDSALGCQEITVSTDNPHYSGQDGVLFSKSGDLLVCCPCNKTGVYSIPDSVLRVGGTAFSGCSGLTAISIPASVVEIGEGAFRGCNRLNDILVTTNNAHYSSKDGILFSKTGDLLISCPGGRTGIYTVPDGVTTIAPYAFYGCAGLTSVDIPDGVASIEPYTFYGCTGLISVEIPAGVTSIGRQAFQWCVSLTSITIPGSVQTIGASAFRLTGLTSVTIQNGVTDIENDAFRGCNYLTSVSIPDSVTHIGEWAFSSCYGLTEVAIPDSVTNIGEGAFSACKGLAKVRVPDSVEFIGQAAFHGCDSLGTIVIPQCVCSTYVNSIFGYNVTNIIVSDGVTNIGDRAFSSFPRLMTATIPDSVTSIGEAAFRDCYSLKTLYVPASWKSKCVDWKLWSAYAEVPAWCKIVYRGPDGTESVMMTGVPDSWLWEYGLGEGTPASFEAAANATAANGRLVWECYVAGLSPIDAGSEFQVKSFAIVDGEVKIEWTPDLNENGTKLERRYTLLGKRSLTDGDWSEIPPGTDVDAEGWRFFRVRVLP